MTSWAERVHRRAADFGSVVTSCGGHPGTSTTAYPYRLEKVKFGVALEEVCKNNNNIPGPLLVLILKLNKESPNRRDVFRAPGHQGAMKKLIHFLQAGRLVNVDNYPVHTIASVLKKFLRKIPNGIFGVAGERELFAIIELEKETEQTERLYRLITSLPSYTQHLLVLLFGTFRVIASNADHAGTGMTSEALGVSVAPSFFQSCVSDGKTAKMEDVLKFKVATKIMKHIIDKFATHDLFGRENYEYYARVTGRILKVQEEWICSFQYPPPPRGKLAQQKYALQHSLEAEKTWLQCQCERWGLLAQEESRSTPALLTSSSSALGNSAISLGMTPENSFIESCARLSVSLEGPGLFAMTSSPLPKQKESEIHKRKSDMHICSDDNDCAAYDNAVDDDSENDADDDDDEVSDEDKNEYCGGENANNATDDTLEQEFEFGMSRKSHGEYISKSRMKIHVHRSYNDNNKDCSDPGGAIAGSGVCDVFYNCRGHNDEGDDGAAVKRHFRQRKPKASKPHNFSLLVLGSSSTSAVNKCVAPSVANAQQRAKMRNTSKSLDGNTKIIREQLEGLQQTSSKIAMTTATLTLTSSGNSTVLGGTGGDGSENTTKVRTCTRCNRNIRHSPSCSSTSAGQGTAVNPEPRHICNHTGINMNELRVVNRYAESTKSLSYLPQVRDEFLLTSRISV